MPWWAAISGYISIQATRPASFLRGVLRIAGTVLGAAIGLLLVPLVAYDHVACCAALLLLTMAGVLGAVVSRYGYAWLMLGLTACIVLLMSLDDPTAALDAAFYRVAEVMLGTVIAMLVAFALAPDRADTAPAPSPDMPGLRRPAILHALRSGVCVAILPVVWGWLELPSLAQTGITVTAVMALPTLPRDGGEQARLIITRGLHRVLGCLLGGLAGLAVLALSLTSLPLWLAALAAGLWVGTHLQYSASGIGYVGVQATIVFIVTLVQGSHPPDSIMPGIDRFAGVFCGLVVLLAVTVLTSPLSSARSGEPG
jgi:uncharacterized membrane protein YccC